ncbi:MAG TPA: hypothetical protein VMV25_04510 [Steroidobacteraceae bacterium]|nr:hypothetical protein [Steroidobacteraceae bacterium]HVC02623.1 hypothetical protein [Steroidobacteraceae bacterium]
MLLERRWIEAHVPQAGSMCLLDEVLDWNADRIRCRSGSHRLADNPLRAAGRLGAACALEYAAQAAAVHASLLADAPQSAPRAGYLASVRDLQLRVLRLDDVAGNLICEAVRIAADGQGILYAFTVDREDAPSASGLVSGRLAIALDGEPPGAPA